MNNATPPTTAPTRHYRPRLTYYHANGKGTGSAVQFELHPAHDSIDGSLFATFATQKTIATGARGESNRTFATFDWQNRITVKLTMTDLCAMLLVFRGHAPSIADGKGLYHSTGQATTLIQLKRLEEPAGFSFEVSRKVDAGEAQRIRIIFNAAEALGFSLAVEQSMSVIAFGIPEIITRNAPNADASIDVREEEDMF